MPDIRTDPRDGFIVHRTVADVIAALKECPQDAIVIGFECGNGVGVIPQEGDNRVLIASTRADWIASSRPKISPPQAKGD